MKKKTRGRKKIPGGRLCHIRLGSKQIKAAKQWAKERGCSFACAVRDMVDHADMWRQL